MDPITGLAAGLSGVANIAGTLMNNQNSQEMQQQAEQFNMAMVKQQEDYQTQMSNSAYQRASADMQKAGLNPAMMFASGSAASSPAGATTSIQPATKTSPLTNIAPAIQSAVQSATALRTANATIDNLVADNAKILAQTKLTDAQTDKQASEFTKNVSDAQLKDAMAENERQRLPTVLNAGLTAKNQMGLSPDARRILDQLGFTGQKADQILSPITSVISSAAGAKKAFSPVAARWP